MALMHFAAFLRQARLPFPVIIFEPATAAAVPTARPMPMPFITDIFFDDENIFIPPIEVSRFYFALGRE